MNTSDLLEYYKNLLITQYYGLPKARATIGSFVSPSLLPQISTETITLSNAPTSGSFVLSYDGVSTAAILWNDSIGTIQTKVQAISALSAVTVTGSISSLTLNITFAGIIPPADLLEVVSNSLVATSTPVTITITQTDLTLPLAIQNAFNIIGSSPAVGVQLDILGHYVGVSRTSAGFQSKITLSDTDFWSLIRFAIIQNTSDSSLYSIVNLLWNYFPQEVFLYDYEDMSFSYMISSSVGSQDLIQVLITEGRLPKPMGVLIRNVIYLANLNNIFAFVSYQNPTQLSNTTGFNNYINYHSNWPWLNYSDGILV